MASLAEIHARDYPDMPIEEFARRVHAKSYSDMAFEEFAGRAGLQMQSPEMGQALSELSAMTRDPRKAAYDAEVQKRAKVLAGSGAFDSLTGGAMRGITFGVGDRLGAALAAPVNAAITYAEGGSFDPMDEYRLARDASFAARDIQRERDPVSSIGGEVLGGVVSGVGAAKAMPGLMGAGTTFGGQVVRGAGQGAATGAIYSGAQAREGEVIGDAAKGAAIGAALGGALPVVARGAKTAYQVADTAVSPYIRPAEFAAKKVAQRIGDDGQTVASITQRLARTPGGTVADVAGENVRGLVRTATNVPGAARQTIPARMNIRQMGANDRVTKAIAENIANPATFNQVAEDIVTRQKTQASPLYESAFRNKKPVDVTPVLKQIDETIAPGISRVASPGNAVGMDSVSGALASVRSRLARGRMQKIDLEQLHLLKQDIDGAIETAQRQGANTLARKLVEVQRSLLRQMDAVSPEYGQARAIFAGEAKLKNAMELGTEFLRAEIGPKQIAAMSEAERDMFRLGVARALKADIDRAVDGADLARRIIGKRQLRDALRVAFPDPKARNKFFAALMRESRFSKTRQAIVGNSSTARQQADLEDAGIGAEAISVMTGRWGEAIRALIARSGARIGGVTPRVAKEVADLTTTRDPAALAGIRQRLAESSRRSDRMETLYRTGLDAAKGLPGALSSMAIRD